MSRKLSSAKKNDAKKSGKSLPKGIREKNGSYEARAVVNKIPIQLNNTDLDKLIVEFELAKERARQNILLKSGDITLTAWFNKWFDEVKAKKVKPQSINPMKRAFNRTFGFYLGTRKLKDIGTFDIQTAMNAMEAKGIAISTIRDALGRIRECMEYAVACRMISYNPCVAVEVPWESARTEEEIPYSQEEQDAFLNELELESNWYIEMFYIMFLTGMRVGEVGGLHWSDVDFKNKCIHINGSLSCSYYEGVKTEEIVVPKTVNSFRKIPFIGEAEEMFIRQKEKVKNLKKILGKRWRAPKSLGDLVFVTTLGSPCSRYVVQKEINKVTDRINERRAMEAVETGIVPETFRHGHPHLLRHTFATRCFEVGIEPKVVQTLMGHATISTTLDIYTHVLEKKRESEVLKFGTAKTTALPNLIGELPKITARSHI